MNDQVQSLLEKAQQFVDAKKYNESINLLDHALEIDSQSAVIHYKKANILQGLNRFEDAIQSYNKALDINPNHAPTYYNRGIAFDELGQHEVLYDIVIS